MGIANNGRGGLAINSISFIAISNQSTDRYVPRCHRPRFLPYSSNAATMIAVILFSDNNLNWALTQTAVVVREFLRATNIHITQFERLTEAHIFEWVFFVDPGFVDRRPDCFVNHRPYSFSQRCFVRD
jgi:hypothetical protein